MPKQSAGLLMFRRRKGKLEVLLAHPGGPMFAKKDEGHWTIPKGELDKDEDPLACAIREFREETGFEPAPPFIPLGSITQRGGKIVHAWAFKGDADPAALNSNRFNLEWPPKSNRFVEIPEVDRVAWLSPKDACRRIKETQTPLIEVLIKAMGE